MRLITSLSHATPKRAELARTININGVYTAFWQGINQIYGVYSIRFWPTLETSKDHHSAERPPQKTKESLGSVNKHIPPEACHQS
jgi:hypothetical protein